MGHFRKVFGVRWP